MLFSAKFLNLLDLDLTLAYQPNELSLSIARNPQALRLLESLEFDFDYRIAVSTEHLTDVGTRSARAVQNVTLQLKRPDAGAAGHPAPWDRNRLLDFLRSKAIRPDAAKEVRSVDASVLAAVATEIAGEAGYTSSAVGGARDLLVFEVSVTREYSIKGLRSEEAIKQRAEDAAMLAERGLLEQRLHLARTHICAVQALLGELLQAFNAEQVKPLLTQIDLGLRPTHAETFSIEDAKSECVAAEENLTLAQQRKEAAWSRYSRAYKRIQLEELEALADGFGDLEAHKVVLLALLCKIDPDTPLRFL